MAETVDALATAGVLGDLAGELAAAVGAGAVIAGDAPAAADHGHDEALGGTPQRPAFVVCPADTAQVAALLRIASERGLAVTARGMGTGVSGAAVPRPGGLLVSFERMTDVQVDTANHVAVVQPGVTLTRLDAILAEHGLCYPVHPGETGSSLGGNVATNAGGMRAVKYGVTRHHVLGVEAVLPGGEVIRTGGKLVKTSTGYDLTQLIIGSEGTLALVTEATLRLHPRPTHQTTLLVPFPDLAAVTAAVPALVASGVGPTLCEYIDAFTMDAITARADLGLGLPPAVLAATAAYLVVALEGHHPDRLDADTAAVGELLAGFGAAETYVLPATAARRLIEAREQAFWVVKAMGADDLVDVVVPRAAMAAFLDRVAALADAVPDARVVGCGHAGDGNVHLAVFCPDPVRRAELMREIFTSGMALGGAISGEHGIGTAKKPWFLALEDPDKIALMRRIKAAFDPAGILNPGVLFD